VIEHEQPLERMPVPAPARVMSRQQNTLS
jgi:hypothetical protein